MIADMTSIEDSTSGAVLAPEDRGAIEQLLSSYGMHHDRREFEALGRCFTDDATYAMVIPDAAQPIEKSGRAAIVDQIRFLKSDQTDQRRHVITNFVFSDVSADRVSVSSYLTVLSVRTHSLEVLTAGVYSDVVVRTKDGWRIAAKALHLDKTF